MGKVLRKEEEYWNIVKGKVKTWNIEEIECFLSIKQSQNVNLEIAWIE